MTFREKLADWISGGSLSYERDRADDYWNALSNITQQETPKANATVKRMAKIAREALGE